MGKKKISGISAGRDLTIGDISSLFVVGENNVVIQEQSTGNAGLEELRKNLLDFQKGVVRLNLSPEYQSVGRYKCCCYRI